MKLKFADYLKQRVSIAKKQGSKEIDISVYLDEDYNVVDKGSAQISFALQMK